MTAKYNLRSSENTINTNQASSKADMLSCAITPTADVCLNTSPSMNVSGRRRKSANSTSLLDALETCTPVCNESTTPHKGLESEICDIPSAANSAHDDSLEQEKPSDMVMRFQLNNDKDITKAPTKRKGRKPTKKKNYASEATGKSMLRKRHLKKLRRNQQTICLQINDMDLKIEEMHELISKLNIQNTLEELLKRTDHLDDNMHKKKNSPRSSSSPPPPSQPDRATKKSMGTQTMDDSSNTEDDSIPTKHQSATIKSLGLQITILESEVDEKVSVIKELQSCIQQSERVKAKEIHSLQATKDTCKFALEKATNDLNRYMQQSAEWDVLMSKKSNEVQEVRLENYQLQKRLDELLSNDKSEEPRQLKELQRENHQLKQRLDEYAKEHTEVAHGKPKNNDEKKNKDAKKNDKEKKFAPTAAVQPADIVILHDSLGHQIKEGIMKRHNLVTEKATTYYVEDSVKHLDKIEVSSKPKTFVLHVGTNNLAKKRQSPEEILPLYMGFVDKMRVKFPGSKLVYSSIVPREDNKATQRLVRYLNAAMNRKFGGAEDVVIVDNFEIKGPRLKQRDGIHLKNDGTSALARNIRDGIKAALNII